MSEMAATEIGNYSRLADRLTTLGVDPDAAMGPFVTPLRAYHGHTQPSDWFEGLAKAHIGDSIADDFTRAVATLVDPPDRELILDVLHESRHAEYAAMELRAAISNDPRLASRLSIWARRLVGEGLSQAMRVAADRPALAALLAVAPGATESDGGVPGLFRRLTAAHTARMTAVGLNN